MSYSNDTRAQCEVCICGQSFNVLPTNGTPLHFLGSVGGCLRLYIFLNSATHRHATDSCLRKTTVALTLTLALLVTSSLMDASRMHPREPGKGTSLQSELISVWQLVRVSDGDDGSL